MKQREPAFSSWRYYLVIALILLVLAGLVARVIDLTFFKQKFLRGQGDERVLRVMNTPALRGMVTDRNGYPLAISTTVYSIWVNPKEFVKTADHYKILAKLLSEKPKDIQAAVEQKKVREFVYIKRDISPALSEKIKALKISGVYAQRGFKRYYPEGEVAAHVIGTTNVDDKGQEGVELAFNAYLSGLPGKELVVKDRIGRVISQIQMYQEQKAGSDVALSIDHRIQYLAYRELLKGVQENIAESGSIVVLDVKTGEILAMANAPSFNPNMHTPQKIENKRNRAVTDVFEPGSTIKAFSLAIALQSGLYKPSSVIDTAPGWVKVGRKIIHDEHVKGLLTLEQILQVSSNVGVTKIMLSLPPSNKLWDLLHNVGFGETTGIGFPGERSGELVDRKPWGQLALATLAFGYGLSVTPLQLAEAYSVIANGGEKKPLSLLSVTEPPTGKIVMDPKLAKEMLHLMESVVQKGGTAEAGAIPGYHVAGKTGTAIKTKVGEHGYQKHRYVSTFIGIAPATDPRLIIVVVMNDPRGKQFLGGFVSAPVFKNVMEGALQILNIDPDDPATLKLQS